VAFSLVCQSLVAIKQRMLTIVFLQRIQAFFEVHLLGLLLLGGEHEVQVIVLYGLRLLTFDLQLLFREHTNRRQ